MLIKKKELLGSFSATVLYTDTESKFILSSLLSGMVLSSCSHFSGEFHFLQKKYQVKTSSSIFAYSKQTFAFLLIHTNILKEIPTGSK